jgi:predicted O-methyltransferase YrrM
MTLPEELHQQIKTEMAQIHHGWTSVERGLEMAELILEHRPSVVLELGCFGGRATIPMALALKHAGCGKIYTVDPWFTEPCLEGENEANKEWWANVDLDEIHKGVIDLIWRLGLEQVCIVIRARSQDVPELFPRISMINVDGNHSEIASCRDVNNYLPRLQQGGFCFLDDADWDTTQKCQEIIMQSCELFKSGDNGHYKIFRKL